MPHPEQWTRLSRCALRACSSSPPRIRRVTADEVRATLQQPRLSAAPGVSDAVAARIASLIPQLLLISQQRTDTDRQIERGLEALAESLDDEPCEHRDVVILRSLPGVGRIVAATMLTEAAGPLAERDYFTLRAHSGTAPVTKRSSNAPSWCTCATPARIACATPSIIGRVAVFSTMRPPARTTIVCGHVATAMHARSGASPTAGFGSSLLCCNRAPSTNPSRFETVNVAC